MSAINLTKGGFLRRVMDYEKNPISDWKFLGDKPAIIDFYAPWCGPCRMLLPIIEELSSEYEGKVDIYKVNVDEEEELANLFGIRSVPTLIFVPMGERPQLAQGALPKPKLKEIIDNVLLKK
ncbi:MAG: thioredoxin [Paludibacteraceae bacterium]|nr:thioredoxin [Paludibacteraceae bacterium]